MTEFIIDASLALSWLLPDERTPDSEPARRQFLAAEAVWVPAHWRLEVCNALWMAERRKRLDAAGVARAVALFVQLPVVVDSETNARAGSEILTLAREHSISVYDAAYLELALRKAAPLGSLDEALRTAASEAGLIVIPSGGK